MRTTQTLLESLAQLEHKLQTELDVSRIVAGPEYLTKLVIRAAIQTVPYIRTSKVVAEELAAILRVVKHVEKIGSELCTEPLWAKIFSNGEVHVLGCAVTQLSHALRLIAVN